MATVTKPMALDETLQETNEILEEIAGALGAVKSVNGKTGIVVLDGRDINLDESASPRVTIKNAVATLQTKAVNISMTNISGDDYLLSITQGI